MENPAESELLRRIKKSIMPIHKYYIESEIFRYISHILLSILLGLLAGGGAILFHYLLEHMRLLFEEHSFIESSGPPFYFIIFIPVFGGIITSFMTFSCRKLLPEKGF